MDATIKKATHISARQMPAAPSRVRAQPGRSWVRPQRDGGVSLASHILGIPMVQDTQDTYGCFRDALYFFIYILYISILEADRRSMRTEGDARKSVTLDGSKVNY